MGVLEHFSRILLVAKADTTDATRKIKQLEGDQKKAAKATLEAQEKANAALERQIIQLGKVAIGVGVAVAAFKRLSDAQQYYAEHARLSAAAQGANISAIQDAAQGLITEHQALQFAAAAMNTEFKLSQKQMEMVARFMIVLRNQGNDLDLVMKQVTKAIVEANAEGLRPFGVIVKGTTGQLKTQTAILKEFERQIRMTQGSLDRLGDEQQRLGVLTEDVKGKFKESLGWYQENTMATLTGALYAWREAEKRNKAMQDLWQTQMEFMNQQLTVVLAGGLDAYRKQRDNFFGVMDEISTALQKWDERWFGPGSRFGPELVLDTMEIDVKKKRGGEKRPRVSIPSAVLNLRRQLQQGVGFFGEDIRGDVEGFEESGRGGAFTVGARPKPGEGLAGILSDVSEMFPMARANAAAEYAKQLQQIIEASKVAAQVNKELEQTYSSLLTTMASAAKAGFDAWITGAESVGDAVKKGIAEGIRALANDMFIKSLYHAAAAIGSAATGNMLAAGKHAEAAAAFGAGAVAAGAVAKGMGAGQAATRGGRGVGGGARVGGRGGGDGQRSETIIIGTIDDNPRRRQRDLLDMLDRADAASGPGLNIVRA